MKKVYANLLGEWVDLTADDECVMGPRFVAPSLWWEENAEIWSPNKKEEHTMYQLDYVHIRYKGKDYRINPIFIQIVED
ncbi:hypothetical protein [Paenibacillus woosongensis]|uniref:Uncharacterized protein n=1 Tax=Paenibacillus woosongensis TaxID=307580 RepID=A0A7X3CNZ1_9BACL|nr:hypothetical protein [Paenibacillus woosongensis]MUG45480.1 hypothetical protein [Paenibacillus woosongensis]